MLLHAATPLLSVGDIMGSDSPEQPTKHIPLPVDGGERKLWWWWVQVTGSAVAEGVATAWAEAVRAAQWLNMCRAPGVFPCIP